MAWTKREGGMLRKTAFHHCPRAMQESSRTWKEGRQVTEEKGQEVEHFTNKIPYTAHPTWGKPQYIIKLVNYAVC